jgi:hypothetical protein
MEQKKQEAGGDVALDINMDIDDMPDCILKYQIIVERAK